MDDEGLLFPHMLSFALCWAMLCKEPELVFCFFVLDDAEVHREPNASSFLACGLEDEDDVKEVVVDAPPPVLKFGRAPVIDVFCG